MAGKKSSTKCFTLAATVLWVASLMAVASPGAVATANVADHGVPITEFVIAEANAEDGPALPLRDKANTEAVGGIPDATGRVTIEIVHTRGIDRLTGEQVASSYGEVLGSSPGVTLVRVPVTELDALQQRLDVEYVRRPLRVDLLPDPLPASESVDSAGVVHVTATNAATWHAAGQFGSGVKVGIIDHFDDTK